MPDVDLNRFVETQAGVFEQALAELSAGRKQSHWMWFVFPQLRGLGRSPTAQFYGLSGRDEASAYADHPLLGDRLRQCCDALLALPDMPVRDVMGSPDDLKLLSSMTLFDAVRPAEDRFARVLGKFYDGRRDRTTLDLLEDV